MTDNLKLLSDLLLKLLSKLPLPVESFLFVFITTLAPSLYNLFTDPHAPAITSNVIVSIVVGALVSAITSLAHIKEVNPTVTVPVAPAATTVITVEPNADSVASISAEPKL